VGRSNRKRTDQPGPADQPQTEPQPQPQSQSNNGRIIHPAEPEGALGGQCRHGSQGTAASAQFYGVKSVPRHWPKAFTKGQTDAASRPNHRHPQITTPPDPVKRRSPTLDSTELNAVPHEQSPAHLVDRHSEDTLLHVGFAELNAAKHRQSLKGISILAQVSNRWWIPRVPAASRECPTKRPLADSRGTPTCTSFTTSWPTASSGRAGQVPLYARRTGGDVTAPIHVGLVGDYSRPSVTLRSPRR
jgi:hypothetical protein